MVVWYGIRCMWCNVLQVTFDKVRVPVENRIGDEGMGFKYMVDVMNGERMVAVVTSIRSTACRPTFPAALSCRVLSSSFFFFPPTALPSLLLLFISACLPLTLSALVSEVIKRVGTHACRCISSILR